MDAQEKHEFKEAIKKIKYATLKAGDKWNNKTMRIAQEMVLARLNKKKIENWETPQPPKIMRDILKQILKKEP